MFVLRVLLPLKCSECHSREFKVSIIRYNPVLMNIFCVKCNKRWVYDEKKLVEKRR